MPEQTTQRGNAITGANFEAPFENVLFRLGIRGLNLKDALDVIAPDQFSRLTNADHNGGGFVTSRPGQTLLATAGTRHHSVRKMRDPDSATFTRIWGIDGNLYLGSSGALTQIDTGYSGNPLALLPHRPPLSGEPWMFVGDSSKMRKVRSDGLDIPIGMVAPTTAITAALGIEARRSICKFEAADTTQAANWTGVPGHDGLGVTIPDTPTKVDDTSPAGPSVYFTINPLGVSQGPYDSWWGIGMNRDLNTLSPVSGAGGDISASDDDIIHMWLKVSDPRNIQEVRIYVVVDATFNPNELPGNDYTGTNSNKNAYVKGFRPNDFVQFVQAKQSQIQAAETARVYALRDESLKDREITDTRASWERTRSVVDPGRARSLQLASGAQEWFELGIIGVSLRRGDFQRLGSTADRDWSTMTGLIIYVRVAGTVAMSVGMDDFYLTGGYGPDSVEPGAQQYDWRYTHYDPRTGAESNPAPVMAVANYLDSRRQQITLTPAASSDSAHRQRFYRRGGSLIANWYFEGVNTSNGGTFSDILTDDGIVAAGTVDIDHFQPVPTVTETGVTVLAQAVPALWGPIEGMLLACGDPYRPGHVYFSIPDEPDHWSASGNVEVCAPSEQLMNGGLIGHQSFVFSRDRMHMLYPNLTGAIGLTAVPSLCKRGLVGRWAFAVGPGGVYFVAQDGIFLSAGGPEEWLSEDIDPLFKGKASYGYNPINLTTAERALRLTIWENKLYFGYQDTAGARQVLILDILKRFWRHARFGREQEGLQGEDEDTLILGGTSSGKSYTHAGFSDDTLAIAVTARTGVVDGQVREEKLLGDQIVECDRQGVTLSLTNYINDEASANPTISINSGTGRQRYILDAFGDTPQRARSINTEIGWSSSTAAPVLYRLGFATTLQPDVTNNRVTNWDDLNHGDEAYVTGVTFDCHTGGINRTIIIERDFAGITATVATLTVNTNGRHKVKFSWPGVAAHKIRIRPNDDCRFWILYKCDWIHQPEPPRISRWDVHFENAWDQYYTGCDLYCDTGGVEKRVQIRIDEVTLLNPETGLNYWPVIANGRRVVHLTLPWGRGHIFHATAIDDNAGVLYSHRWHMEPEPSEQANWNQNFTIAESLRDKWLNGVMLECDTFNAVKNVRVELDGVTLTTLAVQANGRSSLHFSFARVRGRVLRLFPVDGNPGRLYSHAWLFEQQPEAIARWESLEEDRGDTYYTGLDLDVDTLGLAKTIEIFVDGISLGTFSITATTRQLVHLTLGPGRGHVYRFRSTDTNPGYLYAHTWHTDPEPSEQTNWNQNFTVESQLRDKWLKGILIECDTFGQTKTVRVEVDGALHTTLSVLTTNGRSSLAFSWARVRARVLRLLPTDTHPGRLYTREWLFDAEPEQIARWDSNEQLLGDSYYTGLDLEVDTAGATKTVEVYIDQALLGAFNVAASNRRIVHLTFTPGRGHVYRFRATDDNLGYLYSHHWYTDVEPSEQANWHQNFSIYGTRSDKYLKAIIFECDTFGANKQVQVEVDGATVETLTVNANGRRVVQLALATQQLGRVWRMLPVDGNPGRLYSAQPVFDEEPLRLTRWETQELNHNLPGWFQILWAHVTLKCTEDVTLTVTFVANQELGTRITKTYVIPHTAGAKVRRFVSFEAGKGVLVKYLLTSPSAFWLYREETVVQVQPWGSAEMMPISIFGSDDKDPTRPMTSSVLAAQVPGGSLGG